MNFDYTHELVCNIYGDYSKYKYTDGSLKEEIKEAAMKFEKEYSLLKNDIYPFYHAPQKLITLTGLHHTNLEVVYLPFIYNKNVTIQIVN